MLRVRIGLAEFIRNAKNNWKYAVWWISIRSYTTRLLMLRFRLLSFSYACLNSC